jgi:hypothetical protein
MSSRHTNNTSALAILLGIFVGGPFFAGFVALVLHSISVGLSAMVGALPVWAMIVALGCAAVASFRAWKHGDLRRLKQHGVFLLCLPFVWGGGSMFLSATPGNTEHITQNLETIWLAFPSMMGWVTVVLCVGFAICPPDIPDSTAGAKRAEEL